MPSSHPKGEFLPQKLPATATLSCLSASALGQGQQSRPALPQLLRPTMAPAAGRPSGAHELVKKGIRTLGRDVPGAYRSRQESLQRLLPARRSARPTDSPPEAAALAAACPRCSYRAKQRELVKRQLSHWSEMIKIFRHETCAARSGKEITRLESAVSVAFWGTLLPSQLSLLRAPSVWSPPHTHLSCWRRERLQN